MIRYTYIKRGLDEAHGQLSTRIYHLNKAIVERRTATREANVEYHRERKHLRLLNNRKRRLVREMQKLEEVKSTLKPTPRTNPLKRGK